MARTKILLKISLRCFMDRHTDAALLDKCFLQPPQENQGLVELPALNSVALSLNS